MSTKAITFIYLLSITLANILAATFGPSITPYVAFVFIGMDLSLRDSLHEAWRGRALWPRMAALVLAGGALSYAVNRDAGPIAVASCAAFALSGLADALAYHALRGRRWAVRANGSNVVGALVDSLAFPLFAFGLPLLWPIVAGQFVAKTAGGALWSWALGRYRDRQARHAA